MSTGDYQALLAMAIYLIVILAVGFWFARRANQSSEHYFIGGRTLGPWVTAMSAEASDMSGWLLMGLPGVAYFTGASDAVWTAIGLALGTYINWRIVAVRLRKYTHVANNSITLPDFFSNRFHDKRKVLMTISALIILLFFSIYVGSCFVTVGKVFSSLFGFDYGLTMALGGVFVFIYTLLGGYLAGSVDDFIQGVLMFFSLIIIMVGGTIYAGGIGAVINNVQSIPGYLSLTQMATPTLDATTGLQIVQNGLGLYGDATPYGIITILGTLSWGLGYFGMPHVLLRFMGIRSSGELAKSRHIAVTWCVISLFAAVVIGIIGKAIIPTEFLTESSAESIFISLTALLMPPFLVGVVVSGILAATMSSSDSYMLIASAAVARNLYKGLIKKDATERQIMWVARITMLIVIILGIFVAMDPNSSIFQVVSYAWAGFGAAFGPVVLASLFWRRVNFPGAVAGMLTGGVVVVIWRTFIKSLGGVFGVYELLPAFILASLALVVVSLLTTPPSEEITREFDTYMEAEV
jgi:sodium/proline symporter